MKLIKVDGTKRVYVFEDGSMSSFDEPSRTSELRKKQHEVYPIIQPVSQDVKAVDDLIIAQRGRRK